MLASSSNSMYDARCFATKPQFKGHFIEPPSVSSYASPKDLGVAISELRLAFPNPNVVVTDENALKTYGSSENSYHPSSPHAVIVIH